MWVGVVWACILIFVRLRGKIHVGEWCCKVVGSGEVQLNCEVQCSISSQPGKNLCVCVCIWASNISSSQNEQQAAYYFQTAVWPGDR